MTQDKDQLREHLTRVVKEVLPLTPEETISHLITHLTSRSVGVQTLKSLRHVGAEDLPNLGPVERATLLEEFTRIAASSSNPPATHNANNQVPVPQPQQHTSRPALLTDGSKYNFEINWDKIPQETLANLKAAEEIESFAAPQDVDKLKLAIAKQVVEDYQIYRKRNPRAFKCPGIEVYKDVTNKVFHRYPQSLKAVINGKVIGDGKSGFIKSLGICIENLSRPYNKAATSGPPRKIKTGKGMVGVRPEEYAPPLTNVERKEAEAVKEYLKNIHSAGRHNWDWNEVEEKMKITYELQRQDIVNAKTEVVNTQEAEEEPENLGLEDKAMSNLKREWPFLFEVRGMQLHHLRLTEKNLEEEMVKFINNDLDMSLMFLTSLGACKVKNLKLKQRLDKSSNQHSHKILVMVHMLTNHFKEEFHKLILTSERSIQPHEVKYAVHSLTPAPCIVALADDYIEAQKFFICVDEITVMEEKNPPETLMSLFHAAFCFDLDYPDMPKTFEFLERIVFGLGIPDTRISKKNGQIVTVLTQEVQKLATSYEIFKKEMNEENEDDTG